MPCGFCHAQKGRLPLHIAAMTQGMASLEEVKVLLNAHPQAATERDKVRAAPFSSVARVVIIAPHHTWHFRDPFIRCAPFPVAGR